VEEETGENVEDEVPEDEVTEDVYPVVVVSLRLDIPITISFCILFDISLVVEEPRDPEEGMEEPRDPEESVDVSRDPEEGNLLPTDEEDDFLFKNI
jgi:hypothetical protein